MSTQFNNANGTRLFTRPLIPSPERGHAAADARLGTGPSKLTIWVEKTTPLVKLRPVPDECATDDHQRQVQA